jgi:hypothetical protein
MSRVRIPLPALVGMVGGGVVVAWLRAMARGRSRCPAQAQTVTHVVESTGLAGVRRRGLFQHLRGSMFCGALAKCALADFGCDLFQRLWVTVRGDLVMHRARTAPGPPHARICAKASERTQGNDDEPRLARDCCWLRGSSVVPLDAWHNRNTPGGLVDSSLGRGLWLRSLQRRGLLRLSGAHVLMAESGAGDGTTTDSATFPPI